MHAGTVLRHARPAGLVSFRNASEGGEVKLKREEIIAGHNIKSLLLSSPNAAEPASKLWFTSERLARSSGSSWRAMENLACVVLHSVSVHSCMCGNY